MEQAPTTQDVQQQKGFLPGIMTHNTTIIAILLAIAAMIGSEFQEREQVAYDKEQSIEDKRTAIADDVQNYGAELEEMKLGPDTTSEKYISLKEVYDERKDSLNIADAELTKQQEETTKTLAAVKEQTKKSDKANIFFQISVLLSSIAFTNKNKSLTYLALALTVVGIIFIVMMLM